MNYKYPFGRFNGSLIVIEDEFRWHWKSALITTRQYLTEKIKNEPKFHENGSHKMNNGIFGALLSLNLSIIIMKSHCKEGVKYVNLYQRTCITIYNIFTYCNIFKFWKSDKANRTEQNGWLTFVQYGPVIWIIPHQLY